MLQHDQMSFLQFNRTHFLHHVSFWLRSQNDDKHWKPQPQTTWKKYVAKGVNQNLFFFTNYRPSNAELKSILRDLHSWWKIAHRFGVQKGEKVLNYFCCSSSSSYLYPQDGKVSLLPPPPAFFMMPAAIGHANLMNGGGGVGWVWMNGGRRSI